MYDVSVGENLQSGVKNRIYPLSLLHKTNQPISPSTLFKLLITTY
jgi:hypothetical protein